ncbi:MAG: prepilin-type N-terminal cleavage/methylation domain-containing protein [Sphaerospermopsis sp. SIO1G1]|nr:prepilin-type N-terminal cleavage/methylation domain-containing protein [Sphaerospermopsis sp. SIO1G1]
MKFQLQKIKLNLTDHQGFTLIELLVATVIMSLVVTLAGSAFVTLLEKNREEEYEVQRRTNLNRALDYIANEVRRSSQIQAGDPAAGEVLQLTIQEQNPAFTAFASPPNPPYTTVTRIYSVANGTGVWQDNSSGSQTIIRGNDVLVDAIKAPTTPPTCPTGSTMSPSSGGNGFYACIYAGGKKADLYLYGKLTDDQNDPNYNNPLEVKKTVFTRNTAVN